MVLHLCRTTTPAAVHPTPFPSMVDEEQRGEAGKLHTLSAMAAMEVVVARNYRAPLLALGPRSGLTWPPRPPAIKAATAHRLPWVAPVPIHPPSDRACRTPPSAGSPPAARRRLAAPRLPRLSPTGNRTVNAAAAHRLPRGVPVPIHPPPDAPAARRRLPAPRLPHATACRLLACRASHLPATAQSTRLPRIVFRAAPPSLSTLPQTRLPHAAVCRLPACRTSPPAGSSPVAPLTYRR
nr:uncharacterized protein DKFZp434B061-like [Aegilops tauschii subsp. strangulata]